ncbi:hypothetical protein HYU22_01245 [Candidatus Woesearchaeota archaeon]|nr:hypothetical protein [Candidatus Woesearchaeota archaeon]
MDFFILHRIVDIPLTNIENIFSGEVRYHANGVFFFPDQHTVAALTRCNVQDLH